MSPILLVDFSAHFFLLLEIWEAFHIVKDEDKHEDNLVVLFAT